MLQEKGTYTFPPTDPTVEKPGSTILGHEPLSDSTKKERGWFNDPEWRYKMVALFSTLMLSAGSHYVSNSLSSLKSTLKAELGINNTQYGILNGTVSLINTILPFLAGVIMDMFGPGWGAFGSCFCVVLGNLITIIGTYTRTFGLLVAGRLIFGFGSSTIVTTQETILSHWFRGKGLAFSIALHIAVSKLFGWLASATVVEVAERTNFYGNSFWVGEGISLFSLLMVALYALMMWKLNRRKQCVEQFTEEVRNEGTVNSTEPPKHSIFASRDPEKAKKKKVTWRQLYYMVYFPDIYWLLPLNEFVLGAVWTAILNIAAEYVEKRWHENRVMAAWKSSVSMAAPVVVSPVIGLYIDRYGQRGHMVVVSAVLLLISMALLGWTMISPMVSLTLYSVSLTLGPVALTSAVALYLPLNMVGTGIGLIKCGLNFGAVIVDVLIGRLQDNDNDSYDQAMVMMLVLSCVSLVTATAFVIGDYRVEQGIQNANFYRRKELMKARKPREAAIQATAAENASFPRYRYLYGIIVVFLFVISWILYGTYLLVPQ